MTIVDKNELTEDVDLNRKERSILDYIQKHPGVSKQALVDGLDGQYSRASIFGAIPLLERNQLIVVRKDRPNSQVHKLFIRDDSLLLSLIQDLDTFKKDYFQLLKTLQKNADYEHGISFILKIYRHVIEMYLLSALQKWPHQAEDPVLLKRLYTTLFSRLSKMHLELYEIYLQSREHSVWPKLIKDFFLIDPRDTWWTYKYCTKFKAIEEFERVMNIVWKISYEFFPGSHHGLKLGNKELDKFRDWKQLLDLGRKRQNDLEKTAKKTLKYRPDFIEAYLNANANDS